MMLASVTAVKEALHGAAAPMRLRDLERATGYARKTVSKALKELKQHGVVVVRLDLRAGRHKVFSLKSKERT